MKKKIEKRIDELKSEIEGLKKPKIWIPETNGLTQRERIKKCEFLIDELVSLLNS